MQHLSKWLLKLFGWKILGKLPEDKKYIAIVAPHTSNWDFFVCLLGKFSLKMKVDFMIKHQLFFFPLGNILKALGGNPIERHKSNNTVEQIVKAFNEKKELILAITPEGTRSQVKRWKQGFYHIANNAKVPIVMIGLDYKNKKINVSKTFKTTGDIAKDFEVIIDFFKNMHGKFEQALPPAPTN